MPRTVIDLWGMGGVNEWVMSLSHVWLCYLVDCSLPGSSVHGIFQVRILEWVAISFSRGSSWPRDQTQVSHTVGRLFTIWATREARKWVEECGKGRIFSFILKSDSFILYSKQKTGKNVFLLLFSHLVMSSSLQPHGLQHSRLPCPSLSPRACSNSYPLSWWCHPTISSSVTPFFCPQSFLASGSFPMSQVFTAGSQSVGASASVLLKNIQDWFPLGLTALIFLLSNVFSRVFSNTTVRKHQFFCTQPSSSPMSICTWILERP